jgi:hypothetical protein
MTRAAALMAQLGPVEFLFLLLLLQDVRARRSLSALKARGIEYRSAVPIKNFKERSERCGNVLSVDLTGGCWSLSLVSHTRQNLNAAQSTGR